MWSIFVIAVLLVHGYVVMSQTTDQPTCLTGGVCPVDPYRWDVVKNMDTAMDYLNHVYFNDTPNYFLQVPEFVPTVTAQVVAGVIYRMSFEVAKTNCAKGQLGSRPPGLCYPMDYWLCDVTVFDALNSADEVSYAQCMAIERRYHMEPAICGYYFPPEHDGANVIARTTYNKILSMDGMTINYWAYLEELGDVVYPLSTMFDLEGVLTSSESYQIKGLRNNYDYPLATNQWVQVTYTWSSSDGRYNLYINGLLRDLGFARRLEVPISPNITDTSDGFFILGQKITSNDNACSNSKTFTDERFVGYIAHFQIWDHALNETLINALLFSGTDVPASVPKSDVLEGPFELKAGAESFWTDCDHCPFLNATTHPPPTDCGKDDYGYIAWDMDENEAEEWGDPCAAPDLISPIDVDTDALLSGPTVVFDSSNCGQVQTEKYILENDKKTIKITLSEEESLRATICYTAATNMTFNIAEIWFSWPSGHMVDGGRVSLEARISLKDTSGVLPQHVLVILFRLGQLGAPGNAWIESLLPAVRLAREPCERRWETELLPTLDFQHLIDTLQSFHSMFSYVGVPTQPPCTGDVNYFIFEGRHNVVSADQMAEFHCCTRCQLDPNQYRQNAYEWGNFRKVKSSNVPVYFHDVNLGP